MGGPGAGHLAPTIRADRAASVVADGYSCRSQIRQSTDGDPVHLAAAADHMDRLITDTVLSLALAT